MAEAGVSDTDAVNRLLNQEIKCAVKAGLKVLYCIGETSEEQKDWKNTLRKQLETGLDGADKENVAIAYEPVWAMDRQNTARQRLYTDGGRFVKEVTRSSCCIWRRLKSDNAQMLASIPEIDGGLIALPDSLVK